MKLQMHNTIYHIFTDNKDRYTQDYREAKIIYKQFVRLYTNARLYEVVNWQEEKTEEEDCLFSNGSWPC